MRPATLYSLTSYLLFRFRILYVHWVAKKCKMNCRSDEQGIFTGALPCSHAYAGVQIRTSIYVLYGSIGWVGHGVLLR